MGDFFSSLRFLLSHKDQTGPRSTCRPRPDPFECFNFPGPMQRLGIRVANPVLLCREMYWPCPPASSWPRPTSDRQTGALWRALEFGVVEWPTRTLGGSTASRCSEPKGAVLHGHAQRFLVFCFVIRVLTTTTAQCAVGNVTVEDEWCNDGQGYSSFRTLRGLRPGPLHHPVLHSFGMWRSNYLAATLHTRGRAPSHRNSATPVNSAAVTLVPRPVFPEPGVPRLIGCTCRNGGDKMEIAHAAMLTDALLVRMPRGGDARM